MSARSAISLSFAVWLHLLVLSALPDAAAGDQATGFTSGQPLMLAGSQIGLQQSGRKVVKPARVTSPTTVPRPAPKPVLTGMSPIRSCVTAPFDFTAQGRALEAGTYRCATDCRGKSVKVTTRVKPNEIRCRMQGQLSAGQRCRVGVKQGPSWQKQQTVKTCSAPKTRTMKKPGKTRQLVTGRSTAAGSTMAPKSIPKTRSLSSKSLPTIPPPALGKWKKSTPPGTKSATTAGRGAPAEDAKRSGTGAASGSRGLFGSKLSADGDPAMLTQGKPEKLNILGPPDLVVKFDKWAVLKKEGKGGRNKWFVPVWRIKNKGETASAPTTLRVDCFTLVDNNAAYCTGNSSQSVSVPGLAAGKAYQTEPNSQMPQLYMKVKYSRDVKPYTKKSYKLKFVATVDPWQQVPESNEGNNKTTKWRTNIESGPPQSRDAPKISMERAGKGQTIKRGAPVKSTLIKPRQLSRAAGSEASQAQLQLKTTASAPTRLTQGKPEKLNILGPPDLVVKFDKWAVLKKEGKGGRNKWFVPVWRIKNKGETASAPTTLRVDCFTLVDNNAAYCTGNSSQSVSVPGLAAGKAYQTEPNSQMPQLYMKVKYSRDVKPYTKKSYKLKFVATVDPWQQVPESNEGNNKTTKWRTNIESGPPQSRDAPKISMERAGKGQTIKRGAPVKSTLIKPRQSKANGSPNLVARTSAELTLGKQGDMKAKGPPDLVIEFWEWGMFKNEVTGKVSRKGRTGWYIPMWYVRNKGESASTPTTLRVDCITLVDNKELQCSGKSSGSLDVPGLAAGGFYSTRRSMGAPLVYAVYRRTKHGPRLDTKGAYKVKVTATLDPWQLVAESNERNNVATKFWTNTGSSPPKSRDAPKASMERAGKSQTIKRGD